MEQTAIDIKTESTNRTAWMVERNSTLWGHEWFCAGENRWTKDPNKTIQFPDKGSAEEVWSRLLGEESKEFPYSEEGADWVYTISITEHAWIDRAAALLARVTELEEKLAAAEGESVRLRSILENFPMVTDDRNSEEPNE